MAKRPLPLGEVYRLIEPGPVVLVSTMSGGRVFCERGSLGASWAYLIIDLGSPVINGSMTGVSGRRLFTKREDQIVKLTVEGFSKRGDRPQTGSYRAYSGRSPNPDLREAWNYKSR